MPAGAIVAGALTDAGARLYSLTIGGVDVTAEPGATADRYGTPLGSIVVTEAGPGGVSSMEFDVLDPQRELAFPDGAEVLYWDHTKDVAVFRGYLDSTSPAPLDGGQGRLIHVRAVGVEVLLDWLKIPADVVMNTFSSVPAPQLIVAHLSQYAGPNPLRIAAPASGYGVAGAGVARLSDIPGNSGSLTVDTLTAPLAGGTTFRDAIVAIAAACDNGGTPGAPLSVLATVGFDLTLRVWPNVVSGALQRPDDYTDYVVDKGAARFEASREPGDLARGVYVKGSNAAGSGLFWDGSGVLGKVATIDVSSSDTAAKASLAGRSYLAQQLAGWRGSFVYEDWVPASSGIHAGSLIEVTDTATGLSAVDFRIMEITKTFHPTAGRQRWEISFGGLAPSFARLARHHSRLILD